MCKLKFSEIEALLTYLMKFDTLQEKTSFGHNFSIFTPQKRVKNTIKKNLVSNKLRNG